jgi:peptide/nickel transport system substrate-binding protein
VAITAGDQARLEAFQAGEFDLAFFSTPQVVADAEAAGVSTYSVLSGLGTILMYNVGLEVESPTHDLRVRQAIQYALDYDLLNDRVYGGAAEATSAIMPESSPVYGGPGPEYDPERAAELVEEVKAEGWDGSIELLGNDTPMNLDLTITLEGLLEAVGMDVTVVNLPSGDWLARITNDKNFQIAVHGPVVFEETTVADAGYFETGSPANRGGYSDPAYDAAADQMRAAVTREEMKAAMEAVQAAWNDYLPASNVFMNPWWWMLSDEVDGVVWTRDVVPMFHDAVIG